MEWSLSQIDFLLRLGEREAAQLTHGATLPPLFCYPPIHAQSQCLLPAVTLPYYNPLEKGRDGRNKQRRDRGRERGRQRDFPLLLFACVQLEGSECTEQSSRRFEKKKKKEKGTVWLLALSLSLSLTLLCTDVGRRSVPCVRVRQSTVWRKTIIKKRVSFFCFVLCEVAIAEEGRR